MKRTLWMLAGLGILFLPALSEAQEITQTIRGQIIDEISGSSIPGVSVVLLNSDPLKGTTSDENGDFSMTGVPVGRQSVQFSFIGYETRTVRDIMVSSAREVILTISLRESVTEMGALVVRPDQIKNEPINPMALNSARQLSMEEASRYAGGFDDPARLASSFAGVSGSLGDNAIVIRGNAPKGMLWQIDGLEIPTPSHFANVVTIGGGGIIALSSHVITDSDFFTSAFPAEYGNALSGVFDLNLRKGNNQQYEHAVRIGTIGVDAASEGPLGSSGASYLFNYRISTFSLISPLLPEDAGDIMYQNLSYKVHIPTTNAGTFTFWGIGANDRSGTVAEESPEKWIYNQDREDSETPTRFGAMALSHRLLLGERAYLKTSFAASGNGFTLKTDRFTDDGSRLYRREYIKNETGKLTAKTVLNIRAGSMHTNRTGITVNRLGYNQIIRQSAGPEHPIITFLEEAGTSYQIQAFSQSQMSIGRFSINGGLHVHHFVMTGATSLEPRAGIRFQPGQNGFSLSYGRHSLVEPLAFYFADSANRTLGFTRANHIVAGYSRIFIENIQLNLETYYQYLTDVPVVKGSSYSVLNLNNDWFFDDELVNEGAGRNYGVELTLERYLSNGWYGMITGAVFQSEYRGGDDVWRNTRFARGYSGALLGGKEWEFRRGNKVRFLSANGRINILGGNRYSPFDIQQSHMEKDIFYDESRAFTMQEPDIFYADITIDFRTNRSNISSVWSLQLMNVTGHKEFYGHRYNLRDNSIDEERELILIPNISYKIEF